MGSRFLRLLLLMILVVLTACNRPQATAPVTPTEVISQPLGLATIPTPTAETELEKAFLPAISNDGPAPEGVQVDPHVEILASQTELKVGDILTVTGRPVELGLPYYYLTVRDEGVQQVEPLAQVTYENQAKQLSGSSQVLEFVSASGQMDQAIFQLKAIAAGQTTVTISATGEVNVGSSGSSMWSGGGSGDIQITVQP